MDTLFQLFYDEANEMVEGMEQVLLALEGGEPDPETVNALFRYAHSFKGNSAAMGFTHLSKFTHGLESAMEVLRKEQRPLTPEMATLLLQAVDLIRTLLERTRTEGDVGDPNCDTLLAQINAVLNGEPVPSTATTTPTPSQPTNPTPQTESTPSESGTGTRYRVYYQPAPTLSQEHDPLQLLQELKEYGQISDCRFNAQTPPIDQFTPNACYGNWEFTLQTEFEPAIVRAILELSAEGAEVRIEALDAPASTETSPASAEPVSAQATTTSEEPKAVVQSPVNEAPTPQNTGSRGEAQSVRVSTEKIDALMNLVSEIVIAQSMLSSAQSESVDERMMSAITQMERHVRELHERVMAIRMLPVSYLFNRFPRMVRDTANKLGKRVNLVIEGEETELDRTLLEALADPLTHIIRNAIDHGIETPEDRRAKGKPETGTILLSAYQAEGRIYIEVRDDGKGIDTERVRQKAIQLGWITENDHPSQEQLYEFIFQPGFSTAQQVSDLSGRGVGMDVVRRNVESLGGTISIQSELGKGTRMLLRVPLTLAIMDGLGLSVADEHYIVPLTTVIEAFQVETLQRSALFDRYEMVNVRGEFIPLVRLRQIMGLPSSDENGLVIVLEQDGQQIALQVDAIVGQQQVVLKSLEENFVRVPGFAGATILGDGRVALILDVGEIIRRTHANNERFATVA